MLSLNGIHLLFERCGAEQYSGEPMTQLEHTLKTGAICCMNWAPRPRCSVQFAVRLGTRLLKERFGLQRALARAWWCWG